MKSIKYMFILLAVLFLSGCSSTVTNWGTYDDETNGLIVMESDHYMVHEGLGYQVSGTIDNIAAGAVNVFLMNTTTEGVHWRQFIIACDASPILFEFYEAPNVTSYGTSLQSRNRNRFVPNGATAQTYANGTLGVGGTLLFTDKILGQKQDAGSTTAVSLEWILKTNETYAIKLTNQNGNGVNCVYRAFWYEVSH